MYKLKLWVDRSHVRNIPLRDVWKYFMSLNDAYVVKYSSGVKGVMLDVMGSCYRFIATTDGNDIKVNITIADCGKNALNELGKALQMLWKGGLSKQFILGYTIHVDRYAV